MAEPNRIPEIQRYTITVELSAPGGIDKVLEAIADIDEGPSICDVRSAEDQTIWIDTSELTDTQRETLIHAVEMGYYSFPREVRLDRLYKEFDVSKSAISQRLRKAEMTLVQRTVSQMTPRCSSGRR